MKYEIFFFPRDALPNERTDNAIPYISGQGKPRGFKQTKPPLISQGLVILYFSILFDVLTKQDDTGELALKFDFLFFLPSFLLSFFLCNLFPCGQFNVRDALIEVAPLHSSS